MSCWPKVEDFKYLGGVLFNNKGEQSGRLTGVGTVPTWMCTLYWCVMLKRELNVKVEPLIYVPAFTCGNKLWVVMEQMRLWIEVKWTSSMKGGWAHLRDRVRSSVIWKELKVQLLWEKSSRLKLQASDQDGHILLGGFPGAVSGRAGEITHFGWLGNTLVSPQNSWRRWPERGKSECPWLDCSSNDPAVAICVK